MEIEINGSTNIQASATGIEIRENVLGLEKPLKEFVSAIGDPVAKFEMLNVKNKNSVSKAIAKAEAKMIKDLGKIIRLEIGRMYKEGENFDTIICKANEYLKSIKNITPCEVDEDWRMEFFETAKKTSDDDIQDILARILSGQLSGNECTNRRLLDFLRYTDKKELKTFFKLVSISSDIGLYHMGTALAPGRLEKYGLSTQDIFLLSEIGLANCDDKMRALNLNSKGGIVNRISFSDRKLALKGVRDQDSSLSIFQLTEIGKQLYGFCIPYVMCDDKRELYFEDFRAYVESHGYEAWYEFPDDGQK